MPARLNFTPAAIPPNPAPTTTTFGVPAGPNSSSAVGFMDVRRPSWLGHPVPDGKVLDAAVGDRAEALDWSGHVERLEVVDQQRVDNLELDAREQCPHAEVLPEPERDVRVRAAVDAERARLLEHLFVPVRRCEVERDLVAGPDLLAPHLVVPGGHPREVTDRADPPQDLLDGVRQQLAAAPELLPLLRMLAEREQASADGVAGGLVAGLDEELAVQGELQAGERTAVDLGVDQLADQVVVRVVPALLDQAVEIGVHLTAGTLDRLARGLAGPPVLGVLLADHLVRPAEQQIPVVPGNPQHGGDHGEREGSGDALDEVELATAPRGRGVVEDLLRDALDVGAPPPDAARREPRVRGTAHRRVARRIEHDQQVGRGNDLTTAMEGDPLRAREEQRLLGDLHDVGMLRDRPERLVPVGSEVRDRRLGTKPRPHLVRVAPACVARGIDELQGVDGDGRHGRGSLGRSSRRSPMMLRWISLVPPWIELARDASIWWIHRPWSTACSSSGPSSASGPSTATAVSANRWLMPAQNSFTRLDSAPTSSPRSSRVSVRSLCRRKISMSIQTLASRCRTRGSAVRSRRVHDLDSTSNATSWSTCSFQMNDAPRSLASVVFATRQPSCSAPIRFPAGTSTSSRNTSLNSLSPVIWRSGRISTPFEFIGIASMEIPL